MESWKWALALRPVGTLVVMALIVYPIKVMLLKCIPEGRLRRVLLTRLNERRSHR